MDKNTSQSQDSVLVTICCTAYNQEKFIKQCLDGFVMQKTKFRFEAVVHDDASTDNTAAIIKEYAGKYPEIIKPIFEKENQYSKHNGSLRRIMRENMRGKYIATCEADDYWTDPYKLQKQVDILEADPNVSMVYTAFRTVDPNGEFMPRPIYEKYKNKVDVFYVAFSGGKDSVVALDIVQRALPHNSFAVLFGDTGMEFPDTYTVLYSHHYIKIFFIDSLYIKC